MLGKRRLPQLRRVVMMLELLVKRTGALLPQHLHDGDQRSVAGGLRDAQMEQTILSERLACHRSFRVPFPPALPRSRARGSFRRLGGKRRAFAFDHIPRAQELEWTRRRVGTLRGARLATRQHVDPRSDADFDHAPRFRERSALSRTDGRETPSCRARSRSGGNREPAGNSPLLIRPRIWSAICRYNRRGSMLWNGMGGGMRRRPRGRIGPSA